MKKFILPLFLLLVCCGITIAQKVTEYRVIRVHGVVEDEVTKKALKTNDIVPSNHKLKFGSRESRIVLISPQTGRKTISGVPDTQSRELLDLFKSFLEPEQKATASRSIVMEYLEHLQASLAFDTLLILSPGYFPVNTEKLPLAAPAAIKAWFHHNKKITYSKISDASGFRLDQKGIFGETTIEPTPRVILEYFDDEKRDPQFEPGILIAAFVPLYANESTLLAEINAVRAAIGQNPNKIFEEIRTYVAAEYAPPQDDNLKRWLMDKGIISQ